MSHKFSLAYLGNPTKPQEPKKFYAISQVREEVDEDMISKSIAERTSLSQGDVRNVLRSLGLELGTRLSEGDMVSLGTLGTFRLSVRSEGAETREEFTRYNIKNVNLRFVPGSLLKEVMKNLKFEEVLPVEVRKEAMRKLKNS